MPQVISRDAIIIAGVSGVGSRTWEAWNRFDAMDRAALDCVSENGYEIRIGDFVFVGSQVKNNAKTGNFELFALPSAEYAVFDVEVAKGYDSQNIAMNEWLTSNGLGYTERMLGGYSFDGEHSSFDGQNYCVECYDERFKGDDEGSIVEIWIPVERAEV